MKNMYTVIVVLILIALAQLGAQDVYPYGGSSVLLSRRKRFLVFPEGSSLQLVFCLTFPNIPLGNIILWGYTSALAYELPQDPYSPFDHHADPLHRRSDSKAIYFTNDDGKVIYKRPYERKFIVNPAFAKRSTDELSSPHLKKGTRDTLKIDRKQMHASKNKREFLKSENMERRSIEFHRSSRGSLYQKIETMLSGLGGDGRQCLLKTLCLVGRTRDEPQGTFLQEILRAVFTFPKGETDDDFSEAYDRSADLTTSCEEAYPDCSTNESEPI
ncbi:unnamed protein product [Chilo suppressalis]|uniref:Uncharacterized protein n=1 Tax=Chilo suppressalis TaxID=168631 RepID=A0ABN8AYN9_CHISP|nr:hypothetical protein evm_007699 [Chilo suppressalis]CAH0399379.1 unnamed protein product [Chilo suppressalis]